MTRTALLTHRPRTATAPDARPEQASDHQLVFTAGALLAISTAAAAGIIPLTLVDILVLVGVALVLPLALPGRWLWTLAAVAVAVSLRLTPGGPAAALVVPWMIAAVVAGYRQLQANSRRRLQHVAMITATGYAFVAAFAFASSRLGVTLFGIGEPIVELTAVHYTYAGTAALVLAAGLLDTHRPRLRIAQTATTLTAAGPLIVATGFVTHHSVPQVGGAVLMTLGVWLTATLELHTATHRQNHLAARLLSGVSGAAIWIPMVLAIAWAAGQHWNIPALSIPDMEHTHGIANALAFILAGLLAQRTQRRPDPDTSPTTETANTDPAATLSEERS